MHRGRGAAREDSGGVWDWYAGAAPKFDLVEARAAWRCGGRAGAFTRHQQLLRHVSLLPAQEVVRDLVESADLDGPVAVGGTTAGNALRRYVWLVDRVDDGLPLTAAGWLSPAVVTAMDAPWPEDL